MAKKSRSRFWIVKRFFQCLFVVIFMACIVVAVGIYMKYGDTVLSLYSEAEKIVESSKDEDFKAAETSLVYDANGDLLRTLKGEKDVYYLELKDIPQSAQDALVCIEDKKFYKHNGIDLKRIASAALSLVQHRGITQGGSTITQQLVKNVYLTNEVKWTRKIKEAFIAVGVEKKYSKKKILEYYINNIYFNNGYYGIQAAANGYFRKGVSSLSLSQITFLCAIPNSPLEFNPYTSEGKKRTIKRRDLILDQMYADGYITQDEHDEAIAETIKIKKRKKTKISSVDSFVMDSATKALMKKNGFDFRYSFDGEEDRAAYEKEYQDAYNTCEASLYTGGFRIYTSIDPDKQEKLQSSVDQSLAVFTEKGKNNTYALQSSATCIDNNTGRVVAIVGGRKQDDVSGYSLNRAFQSYRQPGSSIKPLIVYTPSLEKGYTPDSAVSDSPIRDTQNAPKNSDGSYMGRITLRKAVEQSRNVVAWRLFSELTPKVGLSYLQKMHYAKIVDSDFVLAASVGGFTYGTNTLEMASGYATICNGGIYREPTCIVSITDSTGKTVVSDKMEETRVYQENATLMMVDVMKGVLTRGTGRGRAISNRMPCAAKTGTTDDNKDGWFCGFSKYYTTTVWVGYDTPRTLTALYGGTYPGKIWQTFMNQIHEGLPAKDWEPYTVNGVKKNSTEEYDEKQTTEEKTTEKKATEEDTEEATTTEEASTAATEAPIVTTQEQQVTTQTPVTEATTQAPATTQAQVTTQAPAVETPAAE